MWGNSVITCKCLHLKVSISSLLQNLNASCFHVAQPLPKGTPMPLSHDYHMAGKWNTGQFYSQIHVQKGVLHLLSTERIRTENAPMIDDSTEVHTQLHRAISVSATALKIKRTYYLRRPVTNPIKNNLSKPPLTQALIFVRTFIGIMY